MLPLGCIHCEMMASSDDGGTVMHLTVDICVDRRFVTW